ncbi:MAG: hypothetical protein AAF498_10385 [Pseudomonadota bacterium]
MSAKPETPLAEVEDIPVVKVAYQTYDDAPSKPPVRVSSGMVITILKAFTVAALMLAYPALVITNHKVDDTPINLADAPRHWTATDAGVAVTLISRELEGPGWVADRHRWHPQSRLTALPAWQNAMMAAIADHGRLSLSLFEGQRDPDLEAAMRLLGRTGTEAAVPRLIAAREALTRYDGRVGAGLAGRPEGPEVLAAEMDLAAGWALASRNALGSIASPGDGWIASTEAVQTVYEAKARAHVAHEILSARMTSDGNTFPSTEAELLALQALEKWRVAAKLRPLFVSNHGADAVVGANHPATMAFLISDAAETSRRAAELLRQPQTELDEQAAGLTDPARAP